MLELLDGPDFAVVATLTSSGAPHTSTVWYVRDGDANANPPEPAEIKRLIVRVTPAKVTELKVSA